MWEAPDFRRSGSEKPRKTARLEKRQRQNKIDGEGSANARRPKTHGRRPDETAATLFIAVSRATRGLLLHPPRKKGSRRQNERLKSPKTKTAQRRRDSSRSLYCKWKEQTEKEGDHRRSSGATSPRSLSAGDNVNATEKRISQEQRSGCREEKGLRAGRRRSKNSASTNELTRGLQ